MVKNKLTTLIYDDIVKSSANKKELNMKFPEWFVKYLGCEWEDCDRNLNESDMQRAFEAGRAYEAKLWQSVATNKD
jgi:hypothetical protein